MSLPLYVQHLPLSCPIGLAQICSNWLLDTIHVLDSYW